MKVLRHAILACAIPVAGCGSTDRARCVPGAQVACACAGGSTGTQVCTREETFGPCTCEPATTSRSTRTRPNEGGASAADLTGPRSRCAARPCAGAPCPSVGLCAHRRSPGELFADLSLSRYPDGERPIRDLPLASSPGPRGSPLESDDDWRI